MIPRTDGLRPPDESRTLRPAVRLDGRFRASLAAVGVCGAALSVVAVATSGVPVGLSVGAGAALAAGNLWLLACIVAALLGASERGPRAAQAGEGDEKNGGEGALPWALLAIMKMFGLFVLVWLLMRYDVVSPLGLLVGFAALPIGVAVAAVVSDRGPRTRD